MTVGIWQVQEQKSMIRGSATGLGSRWKDNVPSNCCGVKPEPCPYLTTLCACSSIPPFPSSAFDHPLTVHHATAILWCGHLQLSVSISQHCGSAKCNWDDFLQGRSLGLKVSEGSVHGCGLHYFCICGKKDIVVRGYGDTIFFSPQ